MATTLNSKYVLAPSLQMYFVSKDTGLPLDSGKVYFYKDNARSVPKPVYQITNTGGLYSYDVLPNPVELSSVGTFQDDNNNDIIPYYYPFNDSSGDIELYYIEVYDKFGVLQFTREAWPNFTDAEISADQDVTNFVPNGQFLSHNNVPASSANSFVANKISQDVTIIAPGGWTFERSAASTAVDLVSFERFGSYTSQPTGNPRYAVKVQTTSAGSDTRKDICLKFWDVNSFASNSQTYNYYFEGYSNTGTDITNCQLVLRKYFGTSGSTTEETVIGQFSLSAQQNKSYNFEILFGTNENDTIGPLDDDYVQLIVRLPPTGVQTAILTDFALTINSEILNQFPPQTDAQQLDETLAGFLPPPAADGSDRYLPVVLGATGLVYDDSSIGKIFSTGYEAPGIGELLCDGSQYRSDDYSTDGIPYSRLQQKLWNSTAKYPRFGTGNSFVSSAINSSNSAEFIISTNTTGSATVTTVDTSGFSLFDVHTGGSYGLLGCRTGSTTLSGWNNIAGSVTDAGAGTSGFTVTQVKNFNVVRGLFNVTTIAAAGLAGKYFIFSSTTGNYYMWFTVDGSGSDPAVVGRTGIRVNLRSTWSDGDVANVVTESLSGHQISTLISNAVASISTGTYFRFYTTTPATFYVWFKIDGVGIDPNVGGAVGIEVDLTTGQTAAQVATAIITAINMKYFKVPDLRGAFQRGWDNGAGFDPNSSTRWGMQGNGLIGGDNIGTYEFDGNLAHNHVGSTFRYTAVNNGGGSTPTLGSDSTTDRSVTVAQDGISESRPFNVYVNYVIKY